MSDELSNKIAAGEVVERPASVVKELVENSIDANSALIKIDVTEAGLTRIKITDDGDGMDEADAKRAFLRHATSKIISEQDLFHVRTLGFRGEALASIAAVSKLTLKTSQGNAAGTQLYMEGGKVIEEDKADARKGTEITVDQLFFNTPARLKYMKTIHTELGHISDVINRLALSHPDIRFELTHNEKLLFQSNGRGDLLQIIAQIYGVSVAKKMVKVEYKTLDYEISGYVCRPEVTRAQRHYMSILVNGRFVRSVPINKAILSGYHTLLPIGRYPIVALDIKMDPILVDVNVHPTKLEVRFSKEKELFTAIETAVKQTFKKERLIPESPLQKPKKTSSVQHAFSFDETSNQTKKKGTTGYRPDKPTDEELARARQLYQHPENINPLENHESIIHEREQLDPHSVVQEKKVTEGQREDVLPSGQTQHPHVGSNEAGASVKATDQAESERVPVLYPVGQHHGTYIVAENETGLYLVDQHAAQERIKYEYYRDKIVETERELQELLMPLTFDFSKQEALLVEQHHDELASIGLFFEPFGQSTYMVRSYPNWFPNGFEEEVIRDIIAQIMEDEKIDLKKLREEAAILMSCKKSIKANHHLTYDDMFRLLEDLRKSSDPFTCPHGRPIIIHFSSYELEKMFKRVM